MPISPQQQQMLNLKRLRLSQMRSTVRPDLGVQTSQSNGFLNDTPQPLPAYPAPGAGPILLNQLVVPPAMVGKVLYMAIVHIGAAGSFVDGSGDVVWRVFRNGAPIKGFEKIYVQIGTLSQPVDCSIPLFQNDLIQVFVEVPAPHVAPVGNPFARLQGLFDYGGAGTVAPAAGGSSSGTTASSVSSSSTTSSSSGGGIHSNIKVKPQN